MKRRLQFLFLIIVFLTLLVPGKAFAKDYFFPSVKITININTDGTFDVVEQRTYQFSGEFHWATYNLQKSGFEGIENFSIGDESGPYEKVDFDNQRERTFILDDLGSSYSVKFYYYANNQKKTFTISYKVIGGIVAYMDVSDFYWKLIGTGWDKKTEILDAYVYLPSPVDANSVNVFGHGPLNGKVERLNGNGAHYYITNVPANTFVEARVVFPSSILNVKTVSQNKLDDIMKEELALAKKANAKRRSVLFGSILIALFPIGMFLWWIYLFRKYGKEYKPSKEIIYTRDIPEEVPPAIVGFLLRFKRVQPSDFTATIMNLIRKGYIAIEEKKEEKGLIFKRTVPVVYLYRTKKEISNLLPHEKLVYSFLFEEVNYKSIFSFVTDFKKLAQIAKQVKSPDEALPEFVGKTNDFVNTDEIQQFIKAHPKEFKTIYDSFLAVVKDEGEKYEFFEKTPPPVIAFTVVAFLMPFITFFFIFITSITNPVFVAFIPLYFVLTGVFIALIFPLSRRSKKGAESYAEWNGLRRFLKEFSNLNIATPPSIALWESYLVYSVTFGISKRVIEQMKIALPNIPEDELRASHFFVASSLASTGNIASSFENIVSSMVTSFNSITSAAVSSSSTGSGGGFSGGGGGGGGGSGGGAG